MSNPNFSPEHSTYEIWKADETSTCLDDYLNDLETDVANKANSNHTHSEYATSDHTHSGYAANNHTHTEYAASNHSHTEYATSDHEHTGYASNNHSHTPASIGAAAASHTHDYAASDHTHTGFANASHGHAIADVTGLQTALDAKASTTYVDDSVSNLLNNSSSAVDSIFELRDAMENNADAIEALETIAGGKAAADHTHGVATTSAAGFQSATDKAKLDGIAANANNYTHPSSHAMSMITGLETALAGKAASNHTHSEYADADHTHSGYATASHTHSGYAASNHTHTASEVGAASSSHTHTPASIGAAASSHTHSEYASSDHNHDDSYLSLDGGTINGNTNVAGILRVQGQQSFYFQQSTMSQTVGTNNATGGTTICCGASADVAINGTNLKTPNIIPRGNNLFTLGNTTYRFKGIYSTSNVNVSSDERLKRDIVPMDNTALAKFVEGLNVVSYNYKDDEEGRKARIGLIAQEVQAVDADLAEFFVNEDEDGMLSIAPADLVFALIAMVQELKKEVDDLKANEK